jgi:hypothetical protein
MKRCGDYRRSCLTNLRPTIARSTLGLKRRRSPRNGLKVRLAGVVAFSHLKPPEPMNSDRRQNGVACWGVTYSPLVPRQLFKAWNVGCATYQNPSRRYNDCVAFPIPPPRPPGDGSLRKLTEHRKSRTANLSPSDYATEDASSHLPLGQGSSSSSMPREESTMTDYVWIQSYKAAFLETDDGKQPHRIREAKGRD